MVRNQPRLPAMQANVSAYLGMIADHEMPSSEGIESNFDERPNSHLYADAA
jgi:hypothetical protein